MKQSGLQGVLATRAAPPHHDQNPHSKSADLEAALVAAYEELVVRDAHGQPAMPCATLHIPALGDIPDQDAKALRRAVLLNQAAQQLRQRESVGQRGSLPVNQLSASQRRA